MGFPGITHVYKWDRKQFNFDHIEMPDFEYRPAVDSKAIHHISEGNAWTHYCMLDLTGKGNPLLAFCNFYDGEIGDLGEWIDLSKLWRWQPLEFREE